MGDAANERRFRLKEVRMFKKIGNFIRSHGVEWFTWKSWIWAIGIYLSFLTVSGFCYFVLKFNDAASMIIGLVVMAGLVWVWTEIDYKKFYGKKK